MPGVLRYNPTGLSYGVKSNAGGVLESPRDTHGHRKDHGKTRHHEDLAKLAPGADAAAPSTPRERKHTYATGTDAKPMPASPSSMDQEAQHYQGLKTPKSGKPPSGRHPVSDASLSDGYACMASCAHCFNCCEY